MGTSQLGGAAARVPITWCVAAIGATLVAPAQAGLLPHLSGHHRAGMENDLSASASLSFAVYDRSGGVPGDTFGTGRAGFDSAFVAGSGSSALDTTAPYLYVYQYVNDGPGDTTVRDPAINGVRISSWGHWPLGLRDAEGDIRGRNPLGEISGDYELAAPPVLGVSGVSIQSVPTQTPNAVFRRRGIIVADIDLAQDTRTGFFGRSSLFGFTSHAAPIVRDFTLAECDNNRVCGGFTGPPAPPAGDYNFDGVVDAADYSVFRDQLGRGGFGWAADGNGDGAVTPADGDIWRANFGRVAEGLASTSRAVPEPGAALIGSLAIGVAGASARRRVA